MLVLSLVKEVEIVGEAAYKVSAATRGSLPSIPWADVIGMRHRLIHAYFDINLDVLWQTLGKTCQTLVSVHESALPPPAWWSDPSEAIPEADWARPLLDGLAAPTSLTPLGLPALSHSTVASWLRSSPNPPMRLIGLAGEAHAR